VRCPELRVEVPHSVSDPFLYVEQNGDRYTVIRSLEAARMSEIADMKVIPLESLGLDEYVANGLDSDAAMLEIAARACAELRVREAIVPGGFPVELADRLRADGIVLGVDQAVFTARRRSKTARQLEGIRRAQVAAEAGTRAAAELLRAADEVDGVLHLDGTPLTSERLKQAVAVAFLANGATGEDFIVAHGEQTCIGHHMGSGPIRVGEPITVDLWPRDMESGFHTDMTRTFVVGEIDAWTRTAYDAVRNAQDAALSALESGAGTEAKAVHDAVEATLSDHGFAVGDVSVGMYHGTGHGVGLSLHEAPSLSSEKPLEAGHVVTVEPGVYDPERGGVRIEDLVVVTRTGYENLTDYSRRLAPSRK